MLLKLEHRQQELLPQSTSLTEVLALQSEKIDFLPLPRALLFAYSVLFLFRVFPSHIILTFLSFAAFLPLVVFTTKPVLFIPSTTHSTLSVHSHRLSFTTNTATPGPSILSNISGSPTLVWGEEGHVSAPTSPLLSPRSPTTTRSRGPGATPFTHLPKPS